MLGVGGRWTLSPYIYLARGASLPRFLINHKPRKYHHLLELLWHFNKLDKPTKETYFSDEKMSSFLGFTMMKNCLGKFPSENCLEVS